MSKGRATVMPRNKPALFRSPVRPGESRLFKKNWNHRGHFPVNAGSTRCIPIQCGACRCRYGVVSVGPGVHTEATPGLKTGTVWTRLKQVVIWFWYWCPNEHLIYAQKRFLPHIIQMWGTIEHETKRNVLYYVYCSKFTSSAWNIFQTRG